MRVSVILFCWTIGLGWSSLLAYCDDIAEDKTQATPSASEQVAAVLADYKAAQSKAYEAYSKAKPEDRQSVWLKFFPKVDDYSKRLWPIVSADPAGAASAQALVWIVMAADGPKPTADRGKALGLIVKHHLNSDDIAKLCRDLQYSRMEGTADFLEKVLSESTSKKARGHACYSLAKIISGDSKRSEKLFERAISEFGELRYRGGTLAAKAKSDLFELRNLSVGLVAPEIKGKDLDGVAFKLSDYRGKVVLLDFWGDW